MRCCLSAAAASALGRNRRILAGFWPLAASRLVFQVSAALVSRCRSCTAPAPFAKGLWVNSRLETALRTLLRAGAPVPPSPMAEGQRPPNATEPRGAALSRGQHGSGVGRIYPQLDFGAGCFNEHRMRRQNVPGAVGGRCERPRARRVRAQAAGGVWVFPGSHPEPQVVALAHPAGGRGTLPRIPGGRTGAPSAPTFGVYL